MRDQMLRNYLETMRFMSKVTDEMMYLCDLANNKIYFTDKYAEQFQLPPMDGMASYTLEEMQQFVYAKNGQKVSFKLDSFENLSDGVLRQEYHFMDKTGKKYRLHSSEKLQHDEKGNPLWIVGHISNIDTSQKVDPLTRLYNAQKLMEDLENCLKEETQGYLILLGIDNFKNINTKYGRNFGNHVLKRMAESLDSLLDLSLTAYRLDSDIFAINAVGSTKEEVEKLYQKIREAVAEQFTLSSGVAEYPAETEKDADGIYQNAENALDSAKKNGKNKQEFFSESIYRELLSRIDFQEELKEAVQSGFQGFSIAYQPQIDSRTCKILGVEALLRYHSGTRGNVPPDEFIPILEQLELIVPVGEWVLKRALQQVKEWRKTIPALHVNVNMSYSQLKDRVIFDQTMASLQELDLPGEVLTLELTESIHLQDYRFFNKIFYQFGKKGVKIAIDDFGTGYSSLGYLKSIAIDEIKIDRCFVSGIQHSAYNYRLLKNMIELARSARIRVCCEGVETEAELRTLNELKPDILQGYLFGKPQTVEEFEERYIRRETEAFRNTRMREEKLCHAKEDKMSEAQHNAKHRKLATILDGMDEIVYVRDRESYELMYLNAAGRELTGIYDYNGRKCYEVMQGRKSPCPFCQQKCVNSESYHTWEQDNEYLHCHFLIKDKLLEWAGKAAQLTVCMNQPGIPKKV